MKAPIAVIIFNRPDHAAKLRDCLRTEEDHELFVISDGARLDKAGEFEQVEACRKIFSDWSGRVHFNYSDKNLGCKKRVSSGLNWVFEHVDRAIILEDDLQPHPRFFTYCDEMLTTFESNENVLSVCGSKIYPGSIEGRDIYFSKYANSWGWATWKRAWAHYDDTFNDNVAFGPFVSTLKKCLGSYRSALYWYFRLRQVLKGSKSSWLYCWVINSFLKNGIHIYPGSNLIINQGFGDQSTHTSRQEPYMPTRYGSCIPEKISLSQNMTVFQKSDQWIDDNMYSKSLRVRFAWIMKKIG